MRTRDRDQNEAETNPQIAGSPSASGTAAAADELRRRAQRLLDLGDETISQALSENSERFLSQNRQRGGE